MGWKRICMFVFFPILLIYMIYKAHHDKISYHTITDLNLPEELDGFSIFFIADIHRRRIQEEMLHSITNQIDVVIIGGDLTERHVPFHRTWKNVQKLQKWNVPICFVWGNNDEEVDIDQLKAILNDEGVHILADEVLHVRKGEKRIQLLGLDYPPSLMSPKIKDFFNTTQQDYSVIITHHPLLYSELNTNEKEKMNVILAAHTHGGQIRIAGLGPYERGSLETYGKTSILVSEGFGYSVLPFRLGTNAESHVITLHTV